MRALVIADIHDDFWAEAHRDPYEGAADLLAGVDLLIVAGDLSNKPRVRWKYALQRLRRALPNAEAHIFPGNHDFYDHRLDDERRLGAIASEFDFSYAQKKVIQARETRFLCATLWTDHELGQGRLSNEASLPRAMNDYRLIRLVRKNYGRISTSDVVSVHHDHRAWLFSELRTPFSGRTVVVTHHAPHPLALGPETASRAGAYASDLTELIEAGRPDEWLFGHVHEAGAFQIGGTRLRNISLGYPHDVTSPRERIERCLMTI